MKNYSDEAKTQKKINVKKIVTLKEVTNTTFEEIKFKIDNLEDLKKIKSLSKKNGKTKIYFKISDKNNSYYFSLKEKRFIDNKLINQLKMNENLLID